MTVRASIGLIGILSRGDRGVVPVPTRENNRLWRVFNALEACQVTGVPVVYSDDDEVRQQLLSLDGVLIWVNPIENNQSRIKLDRMLRDVAEQGVWGQRPSRCYIEDGTKRGFVPNTTPRVGNGHVAI